MVIRRRLRSIVFPLALYAFSGCVSGYFVWHAINGERGLKAKEAYRAQVELLGKEQAELNRARRALEWRIANMREDSLDRDLLEEEARVQLGRVHRNDVVVFVKAGTGVAAPQRPQP